MRGTVEPAARLLAAVLAVLAVLAVVTPPPPASAVVPGFRREYLGAFPGLLVLEFLPDGRALLGLRRGLVLVGNLSDTARDPPSTYLDLEPVCSSGGEKGLLGLTLDPDFASNSFVYMFYCRNNQAGPDGAPASLCRLSRFTHEGDTASFASEAVIFVDPSSFYNQAPSVLAFHDIHFGGALGFGPDGLLYLSTGDKSVAANAQDPTNYYGCIMRMRKDGTFPPGNAGDPATAPGCWVLGLRNGFRAAWDLPSRRYFVGEVGGAERAKSREDVHVLTPEDGGTNLGWPLCEGPCDNPDFPLCTCGVHQNPAISYPQQGSGRAVIGGVVYRGGQYPPEFEGVYFYGDFALSQIWYSPFEGDGLQPTGAPVEFDTLERVVGFKVSPSAGHLHAFEWRGGEVYRYISTVGETNAPPAVAGVAVSTERPARDVGVEFVATVSDPDGDVLTYFWVFGDGTTGSGATVTHAYTTLGTYTVLFLVEDGQGHRVLHPVSSDLTVGDLPTITSVTVTGSGSPFVAGQTFTLQAAATAADGNELSDGQLTWSVEFKHDDHFHPLATLSQTPDMSYTIPQRGHTFSGDTGVRLAVTATDGAGLQSTEEVLLLPLKRDIRVETEPCGLTVVLDGLPVQAKCETNGHATDSLGGFEHSAEPFDPEVCIGVGLLRFTGWKKKGNRGAVVSEDGATFLQVGSSPLTSVFTAVYAPVGPCATRGLVLHLVGDLVKKRKGLVTQWLDQSGRGSDLHRVDGSTGPTTGVGSSICNHAFVAFDGKAQALGLDGAELSKLPAAASARSVFMVVRYLGAGTGGLAWGKAGDCGGVFGLGVGAQRRYQVEPACGGAGTSSVKALKWAIHEVRVTRGGRKLDHRVDGERVSASGNTEAWPQKTLQTGKKGSLRIGREVGGSAHSKLQLAEVLVYSRSVSNRDRDSIVAYLQAKYGL